MVPNLIEQVYARMVDAIAEGVLAPGDRLTQEDLAERLSVSRRPVSHALQLLKRQGLVVEHGRRGLSVAPIEAKRMRDLYELRAAIDGLASRLAAERVVRREAPRPGIDRLRRLLETGKALPQAASIHDWIECDVAFHQGIYELAGNSAIAETERALPHFRRSMGTSLADLEVRTAIWAEHSAIAEGIMSGAPRAAESAATHHAEKAGVALYHRLNGEAAVAGSARLA